MTMLQRPIKRLAPRSSRRTLLDLENSLRVVYRFMGLRFARRRIFRREIISVSWRYSDPPRFLGLGKAELKITSLRTNHFRSDGLCLCKKSLYELVRSNVHGRAGRPIPRTSGSRIRLRLARNHRARRRIEKPYRRVYVKKPVKPFALSSRWSRLVRLCWSTTPRESGSFALLKGNRLCTGQSTEPSPLRKRVKTLNRDGSYYPELG